MCLKGFHLRTPFEENGVAPRKAGRWEDPPESSVPKDPSTVTADAQSGDAPVEPPPEPPVQMEASRSLQCIQFTRVELSCAYTAYIRIQRSWMYYDIMWVTSCVMWTPCICLRCTIHMSTYACMQIHGDNSALLGLLPLRWPELPEPRDGGGQGLPVQPETLPWKTSSPEVVWGELPSIPLIPPALRPPSLEALPGVCGCSSGFGALWHFKLSVEHHPCVSTRITRTLFLRRTVARQEQWFPMVFHHCHFWETSGSYLWSYQIKLPKAIQRPHFLPSLHAFLQALGRSNWILRKQ